MAGTIPLSDLELQAFLAALSRRPLRDQTLALTALYTGLRATCLLGLRVTDVWDGQRVRSPIFVARSRQKNGRGVYRRSVNGRFVPVHEHLHRVLAEYLAEHAARAPLHPHAPLFPSAKGGALGIWMYNHILSETMLDAGISRHGRSSHCLRKTYSRLILDACAGRIHVLQAALGHRHLASTAAYLPPMDEAAAEATMSIDVAGDRQFAAPGLRVIDSA